jgi:hypothetical protein
LQKLIPRSILIRQSLQSKLAVALAGDEKRCSPVVAHETYTPASAVQSWSLPGPSAAGKWYGGSGGSSNIGGGGGDSNIRILESAALQVSS